MAKHPVTRRLEFDAGHRLLNHEGKCANYHGHRYVVEVTCSEQDGLDKVGRTVDFSVIKTKVGGWLDEHWDHGMVLQHTDPLLGAFQAEGSKVFAIARPPTAENMAELIYAVACSALAYDHVKVEKVRVWETPNCYAEFTGP